MKRFGVISCTDLEKWGYSETVVLRYFDYFKANNDDEWIGFHACRGEVPPLEDIQNFDGFLISGSTSSVNDDKEWIRKLEDVVRKVSELNDTGKQIRIVGICFGHQLITKALGGRVGLNPDKNFILQTELIDATKESGKAKAFQVLFDNGPLRAVKSHGECIIELPKGAITLANSLNCEHEIVQFTEDIIGVQFHPDVHASEADELIIPSISKAYNWDSDQVSKASQSFKLKCNAHEFNSVIAKFVHNNNNNK